MLSFIHRDNFKNQLEKKLSLFSWTHPLAAFLLFFILVPVGILCGVMAAVFVLSVPMMIFLTF